MAPPILSKVQRALARVKSDLAGQSDLPDEVAAALVFAAFANRQTQAIAVGVGRSQDLVEAWGNPNDRKPGPHFRLAQVVDAALDAGLPRARTLLLLDWLEARYERVALDLPTTGSLPVTPADLPEGLHAVAAAFEALVSLADDAPDGPDEFRAARASLAVLHAWLLEIDARIGAGLAAKGSLP